MLDYLEFDLIVRFGLVFPRNSCMKHVFFVFFKNTIFVSSHMYPENPEGTQVIVGSMNMAYISDTARNRTHNLFRPKRESIPLGHSDGCYILILARANSVLLA